LAKTTRRAFIRAVAAGAALPWLRGSGAAPGSKIGLAFVGVGHRGRDVFFQFWFYREMFNVVALCDVHMDGPHTRQVLEACPSAPRYADFRKMLEEKGCDIDAVVVCTPDFSHFPAVMLAISMHKAVFVEKPMCNTFRETALMTAAAARHGVVTQMGNQGHSDANYWQMRQLVADGNIKDVSSIDAWMCSSRRWHKWRGVEMTEMPGGETPPPGLDWNLWLSQRPERSYSKNYVDGEWRSFYEYGTGSLGDWGAHLFDAAHEFLRLGLPSRIETVRNEGRTKVVYPMASTTLFVFPARGPGLPECRLTWRDGIGNYPDFPAERTDSKWKPGANGAMLRCSDGRVFARGSHGSPLFPIAGLDPLDSDVKHMMRDYPRGKSGHYLNFLKAVLGEETPNSPFEVAGPLSQVLALGALAQRLAMPALSFDRAACRFVGDGADQANACLDGPPPRKGWEFLYKV
jgi:predicted dehydrogenase